MFTCVGKTGPIFSFDYLPQELTSVLLLHFSPGKKLTNTTCLV
jgi:hypothetical protein